MIIKQKKKIGLAKVIIVFVVLAFIVGIFSSIYLSFNDHEYTVTITGKERVNKNDDSKYLIFGEDKNGIVHVFENTDTTLRLKFNSSDIYGKIKEGETYTFVVTGIRIPVFDEYENIIKVK